MFHPFRSIRMRMKLESLFYCWVGEILALVITGFLDFKLLMMESFVLPKIKLLGQMETI